MSRLKERIENFNKAFEIFSLSVNGYKNEPQNVLMHMALIQSFEICYEIGWKVLKDILKSKDVEVYTPRDVIKSAFSANILPTAQIWIDMAQDRNLSSHEYNTDKINIIIQKISSEYFDELKRFKDELGKYEE